MNTYCSQPRLSYLTLKKQIDKAVLKVLLSGQYILGPEVAAFEKEFASYIGVKYAIGISCGTEALHLALKALGIGRGDEVITVSHTAVATVQAIELAGATPVLVDIEPDYFTIDPTKIKKAITKKTKAIIPVHLYGQSADLAPILKLARKYKLKVVEDCCQAHGEVYHNKKVGAWGDIGCFSFYPTKNLGCFGDGGMVVTNNAKLAKKVRMLRTHGWDKHYISELSGCNACLDEIQAAVLRVKLKHLNINIQKRRLIAHYYRQMLTSVTLPKKRDKTRSTYHQFVIRTYFRNELKMVLEANHIYPLIHYPVPIHMQPAYNGYIKTSGRLKVTEGISNTILSLPIYPELTLKEQKLIIRRINEYLQNMPF